MSHVYNFDIEPERENAAFNTEFPLPTYEEVCGSENQIGFKRDVLCVPTASAPGGNDIDEIRPVNIENFRLNYERRQKSNKRGFIFGISGLIFCVYLITVIVLLRRKNCTLQQVSQESDHDFEENRIQASYQRCMDENRNLQRQVDGRMSDTQLHNLIRDHKSAISKNQQLENRLQDLQKQLDEYIVQKGRLEMQLTSAGVTPVYNFTHPDDVKPSETGQKQPHAEKKKTKWERLDELIQTPHFGTDWLVKVQDILKLPE